MRWKYIDMNAKLTSYIFDEYVCSGEYIHKQICVKIYILTWMQNSPACVFHKFNYLANLVGIGVVGKMWRWGFRILWPWNIFIILNLLTLKQTVLFILNRLTLKQVLFDYFKSCDPETVGFWWFLFLMVFDDFKYFDPETNVFLSF